MTISQKVELLRQFPFFAGLSSEVLTVLASEAALTEIPRHYYIYTPGTPSDRFFLLLKGRIKIGTYSRSNKECVRDILNPLSYFGEMCLTGEEEHTGFAMAMHEGCSLLEIRAEVLLRQMAHNLQLNLLIMQLFGRRVRHAEHRLSDLIDKDARTRIIDFIKDTVLQQGRPVGKEVYYKHGLTQNDIASITGTSRQTVTIVLNDLRKSKWIHFTRNSIIIREPEKLKASYLTGINQSA